MKPASTSRHPSGHRAATGFGPASEHHEPVGCEVTATMPFDDMLEDMAEIDHLGDAGPQLAGRDGRAYSGFR